MKSLKYYMNLEYPVVIRDIPPDLGGGYEANIPLLGSAAFVGCGETIEEALNDLNSIKQTLFRDLLKYGIEIVEPPEDLDYHKKLTLNLPDALYKKLVRQSKSNSSSLNDYILEILIRAVSSPFSSPYERCKRNIKRSLEDNNFGKQENEKWPEAG